MQAPHRAAGVPTAAQAQDSHSMSVHMTLLSKMQTFLLYTLLTFWRAGYISADWHETDAQNPLCLQENLDFVASIFQRVC